LIPIMALPSHVHVVEHPLIADRLTTLRDEETSVPDFRRCLHEISLLMAYEVTRSLSTVARTVKTPMESTEGTALGRGVVLVPILRAGLGMLDGVLQLLPEAAVGHIGMARNEETLLPESYYCNLPTGSGEADLILIDPMLATGSSSIEAARQLKAEGARTILFLCLVSCPEGIARFTEAHPDIPIYTASVDRCLSEKGYIMPGLGDAGDRCFGTL